MTPFARAGRGPRPGFTLVELLTVISIIGLLIGLIVAGAMKFREAQVRNTADGQVTRLQQRLNDEYDSVSRKYQRETPPDAVLALAGGSPDRARSVHLAAALRTNFPDNFAEAATPVVVNGYRYEPKTTFRAVWGVTGVPDDKQSAILLFLILTERSSGGGTGDDSGTAGERKTERLGTPAKDFTYFIDLAGNPIIYRRWARNAELDAAPYAVGSAGSIDPLDPKNVVAPWTSTDATTLAEINRVRTALQFGNPTTPGRNRVPTVVNLGKDGRFDYFTAKGQQLPVPPYQTGDQSNEDDRVGYRLNRLGNKGDGK